MRKLLLAATAASSLMLGGCNEIDVAQVQQATAIACGFVPTAIQIAEWTTGSPLVASAGQIAQLICSAIVQQKAARYRGAAREVTVHVRLPDGRTADVSGYFVR